MRHTKEKGGGRREKVSALVQKTLRSACGGVELKYDGVPLRRIVVESQIVGRHNARPDFGHTFVSLFPFLRALCSAFDLSCLDCLSSHRSYSSSCSSNCSLENTNCVIPFCDSFKCFIIQLNLAQAILCTYGMIRFCNWVV